MSKEKVEYSHTSINGSKEEHVEAVRSIFTILESLLMISLAINADIELTNGTKVLPPEMTKKSKDAINGIICKMFVALPEEAKECVISGIANKNYHMNFSEIHEADRNENPEQKKATNDGQHYDSTQEGNDAGYTGSLERALD